MEEPASDFTPRPYQVDLYERAVKENIIIYLPTGSGKTCIAVMLIKKYSSQVQLPYNEGGKRIVFIVNTVPLVYQQYAYIGKLTGLTCKGYTGDMGVDFWNKEDWQTEIEQAQVLVMVGDIFLNILNHGHMQLSSVCLLIFDECHKAVGNHPMRNIMKCFERSKKEECPRILGLTATLLNANVRVERVNATIRELEITFHARVATVDSESSVKEYGSLREDFTIFEPPNVYGIEEKLREICNYTITIIDCIKLKGTFEAVLSSKEMRPKSKNDKLKNIIDDAMKHIEITGLYGGSKTILTHMIQLECIKKFTDDSQTVAVIEFIITQLTKMRKLIFDQMGDLSELEQLRKFSSDQVLKTLTVLQDFKAKRKANQKFFCIIFVRRRTTAQTLFQIIKNLRELDKAFEFLIPEYVVGFANNPYKNLREAQCMSKWNNDALKKFRSGVSNCLIATDVVDEGVDIPACTLIVRYDLPADFRGYVQSKGRARDKSGLYAMLIPRTDQSFMTKLQSYHLVDQYMKGALVGQSDERKEVSAQEIHDNLYKKDIKPYVVLNPDGVESAVTEISAISLINRYCRTLIKSKFVNLTPIWMLRVIKSAEGMPNYQVLLTLPSISPLRKTIHGDVMSSMVLAKRSAALKACMELHKMKEFSDHLLPIKPSEFLTRADHLFPHWVDEPSTNGPQPGTTAKSRHHDIVYPKSLYAAFPTEKKPLYLHVIEAKPTYPKPYENRAMVFYDLLNDDAGFAILSTKPMPQIPGFPVFMNVGSLNVSVKVNHSKIRLSCKEITELRMFHWLIFHNVLGVIMKFMVFDTHNQGNSFLVVPTNARGQIDWEVVTKYKIIEEVPSAENSSILDYELALVKPNYRSASSVYVVTQICDDIMAESSFPTEDFYSYADYYKERHALVIRDLKQPMLEVKAISTKINCLRPRGLKAGLSKRKRADLLEDFQEHFVGELCNRIIFPALYWLKASYLPTVLHRICQLLVAEDLRMQIVEEANLGIGKLRPGASWPPLVIEQNNVEESQETLLDISGWTHDDSLLSAESEVDVPAPEVDILGLDSNLYPWTKDQEPANLYKDIEHIQLIDIEYFHQFMTIPIDTNDDILKSRCSQKFEMRTTVTAPQLNIFKSHDSNGPSPAFIMQALTSKQARDVFDLERLETLGDSLLKFAVSSYLFEAYPTCSEGQLTVIKGKMIGNRNLFYCGLKKQIPGRIKTDDFVPKSNFTPPSYCVQRQIQQILLQNNISPNVLYELSIPPNEQLTGSLTNQTLTPIEERVMSWNDTNMHTGMLNFLDKQVLPDKSVADSVEALIGVYLSKMGLLGAFKILMWLGILPEKLAVDRILYHPLESPRIGEGNITDQMPMANFIEGQIKYKFNDRAYLLQAFTHPSYTPNNITPTYERLEFLGDALLDFFITVHIYETCECLTPGALTDLRSALVNNVTFACLAVKYGFHTALLAYAPSLQEIIERFVKFQEDRNYAVDDELLWILLEEDECRMAEHVDVPKILGDLFESVIGAIYLDSGKDFNKTWQIVYSLMHKEIAAFSKCVPKQPIRVIYETPGAQPRFSNSSIVEGTDSVMVTLEVTVAGKLKTFHGFGGNKKQAKCAAAKQALKCIRSNV